MNTLHNTMVMRQKRRRTLVTYMAAVMSLVLIVTLVLLKQSKKSIVPLVRFDPKKCVRVFDVSRVYKIKNNPLVPNQVFFATAEGLRVLDESLAQWTRYGMDHGLMSETISDVCFDGSTAWVATWSGIARLDSASNQFIPLPFSAGFGGARILAIEAAAHHKILFSIDGRGLYCYDNLHAPELFKLPDVNLSDRVTLIEKIDSSVYIGVENRRLFKYLPATGEIKQFTFDSTDAPKTLMWDVLEHGGKLYVATSDDGLWYADSGSMHMQRLQGFPAKGAFCFSAENDGFWCGTPFGLWRYYEQGSVWMQFVHPDENEATDFQVFTLMSTPNNLWYGSMDLGAGMFDKTNVQWLPFRSGLTSPNVAAIAANETNLWTGFGYQGGYLDRFTAQNVQFVRNYNSRDNLYEPNIQYLEFFDNVLFFSGYRNFGYIDVQKGSKKIYSLDDSLLYGDITSMVAADSANMLLGSQFGLVKHNVVTGSFHSIAPTLQHRITSMTWVNNELWYGTLVNGVYRYSPQTDSALPVGLAQKSRIQGLVALPQKVFVATMEDGCYLVDKKSGVVENLSPPKAVSGGSSKDFNNNIMVVRSIDGRVWIGTRSNGCIIYEPQTQRWARFSFYNGLVSDQIRALYDTPQSLLIGCYGGFNKIEKHYLDTILFNQ